MSSQDAIRNLVREFNVGHDRLDVLINNAGMTQSRRIETADGLESVFATNHLGPFLLTNLLLPVLTPSAPSRVVIVSSGAHTMGKIDFDDLQFARKYDEIRAYNQSKLANLLASSPEVVGVSSRYFNQKGEAKSSKASYDESAAKRLWDVSAALTRLNS